MIIGTELDQEKIVKELDQCLVNGDEIDSDWNQLEVLSVAFKILLLYYVVSLSFSNLPMIWIF
jgi:putative Mn2+ efflux pump MntP